MGFEYVYAYLENLEWFFVIGTIVLAIALVCLIIGRVTNEIDSDDWRLMMFAAVPLLAVFIFFDLSPSMDHIRKVRTTVTVPYVEPVKAVEAKADETPVTYYPTNYCTNSLTCTGK